MNNSNSLSENSFSNENNRKVLVKEFVCNDNENLIIKIDEKSSILVNPNLCEVFQEYISQNKVIYLNIKGYLNKNSFDRYEGYYRFIEYNNYLKDGLKGKSKVFSLEFSNFGFVENTEALKKNVAYRIFSTHFNVMKNNKKEKNSSSGKYELIFILKPTSNSRQRPH